VICLVKPHISSSTVSVLMFMPDFTSGSPVLKIPPLYYIGVFDQMAEAPVNYGHLVSTDYLQYTTMAPCYYCIEST
jgi:hypothetical protein